MCFAIHELIHKLAAPGFRQSLGPVLDEGITEFVTQTVCMETKNRWADAYPEERELVGMILQDGVVNVDKLLQAYFSDPNILERVS